MRHDDQSGVALPSVRARNKTLPRATAAVCRPTRIDAIRACPQADRSAVCDHGTECQPTTVGLLLLCMPLKSIRAWLGVDRPAKDEFAPLRETLEALDHLEPDRARYLGAFAYLLGRVANADQHVSPEETSAMETLVREHGRLPRDQAIIVVRLAKTSSLLFGGTANFLVAREFSALATYDQKLALMRCLFEVSATDEAISISEEGEIHRIANELRIDQPDLVALRVAHRRHLPGVSREKPFPRE